MPVTDEIYPEGYIEKRARFSPEFLFVIDVILARHAPLRLAETNPVAFFVLATCVIPLICHVIGEAATNAANAKKRAEIYKALVKIANSADSESRISLIQTQSSIAALNEGIIETYDLALCPLPALRCILREDNLARIRESKIAVDTAKANLTSQIEALDRQIYVPGAPMRAINDPLVEQKFALQMQLRETKSLLESIRDNSFDLSDPDLPLTEKPDGFSPGFWGASVAGSGASASRSAASEGAADAAAPKDKSCCLQ